MANQTDLHCMCVHKFDNIPCGIPTKYSNEKFYLKVVFVHSIVLLNIFLIK